MTADNVYVMNPNDITSDTIDNWLYQEWAKDYTVFLESLKVPLKDAKMVEIGEFVEAGQFPLKELPGGQDRSILMFDGVPGLMANTGRIDSIKIKRLIPFFDWMSGNLLAWKRVA